MLRFGISLRLITNQTKQTCFEVLRILQRFRVERKNFLRYVAKCDATRERPYIAESKCTSWEKGRGWGSVGVNKNSSFCWKSLGKCFFGLSMVFCASISFTNVVPLMLLITVWLWIKRNSPISERNGVWLHQQRGFSIRGVHGNALDAIEKHLPKETWRNGGEMKRIRKVYG